MSSTTAMESVKRSSARINRPSKMSSTQKGIQKPPGGPHPVTHSSRKLTTAANAIPEDDKEPTLVEQCQINPDNGSVSMPGLLQIATKGPQSFGVLEPPKREPASANNAKKKGINCEQDMDNPPRLQDINQQIFADDEDSLFNLESEDSPTEMEDPYKEIDDSFLIGAPIKATMPPELAVAKPHRGKKGGRKTAKVISIKAIADAMGGE